jgi:hypothetical protein
MTAGMGNRVTVHFRLSADGGRTVLDGWCIIVVRLRHITLTNDKDRHAQRACL